jgi:hypothetical protein
MREWLRWRIVWYNWRQMKAPRFKYFNPDRPDDGPSIPGTGQFWKWEKIFWQLR